MENKRKFFKGFSLIWVAIGLIFGILILFIVHDRYQEQDHSPSVCGGSGCFAVELARTSAEQEKGLMYRESLNDDAGMLFIFPTMGSYNFRMKNTLIPLDMVRIDDQLYTVKVLTADPCTTDPCAVYAPGLAAKYVLEINAGMAAKYGITEGTKIHFLELRP